MAIVTETKRLILSHHTPDSIELLHPIVSDPETMSFYPAPFTREKTEAWIARSLVQYEKNGFGRYAVRLKSTGEFIGCVGFFIVEINGRQENDLGYLIEKSQWGRGYATEASQACLELAASQHWFRRVAIQMATDHIASRRVAERLGSTHECDFVSERNLGRLMHLFAIDLAD
jgi:ribosomal-protein-alanine N-acetyltransferase